MDGFTEDELESARKVLRAMLGHPEPEPATGNVVAQEGRTTGAPGISPDQYRLDFLDRITGRTPMYGSELPEKDS